MNRIGPALGLGFLLFLAGCPLDTPAQSGEAATSAISISGSAFHPGTAHNVVGQAITFTNNDNFNHAVTWDSVPSGASNTASGSFGHNGTYDYTPTAAGTYQYHCTLHGVGMKGTLVITAP